MPLPDFQQTTRHKHSAASAEQKRQPGRGSSGTLPAKTTANCACGGQCPRCRDAANTSKPALGIEHRRIVDMPTEASPQSVLRNAVHRDVGETLPSTLMTGWSARLGRDLSTIRVHRQPEIAQAVAEGGVNGLSYGQHLFFAPGRYQPSSTAGRGLIGHELTHALQSPPSLHSARLPAISTRDTASEAEADRVGSALSQDLHAPIVAPAPMQTPNWQGDKQIAFSGSNITVSDTYVIFGDAATSAFLARFQSALDTFYNGQTFSYRGYSVTFNLSVRMARYGTYSRMVSREGDVIDETYMMDSAWDGDTSLFQVNTGSGDAGGILVLTLYEGDDEGVIAHEVGHYLSDRVGIFSEGYEEGFLSRLSALTGIGERDGSRIKPEAIMPDGRVDIMGSTSGSVTDFSLSGILDEAIDEHEETP